MTIRFELPPAARALLNDEAERRGVSVEQCAVSMLWEGLNRRASPGAGDETSAGKSLTDERLARLDELLGMFSDVKAPDVSNESLQREFLYEDRGL